MPSEVAAHGWQIAIADSRYLERQRAAGSSGQKKNRTERDITRSGNGGAGNRTPVRNGIHHSIYVRIPLIEVSETLASGQPTLEQVF